MMRRQLILIAFIVTLASSPIEQSSQVDAKAVSKEVIHYEDEIQANFRNFFNSISKKDIGKAVNYRDILEREAEREQQAFITVKQAVKDEQWRNAFKQKTVNSGIGGIDGDAAQFKREIHTGTGESEVKRESTLAGEKSTVTADKGDNVSGVKADEKKEAEKGDANNEKNSAINPHPQQIKGPYRTAHLGGEQDKVDDNEGPTRSQNRYYPPYGKRKDITSMHDERDDLPSYDRRGGARSYRPDSRPVYDSRDNIRSSYDRPYDRPSYNRRDGARSLYEWPGDRPLYGNRDGARPSYDRRNNLSPDDDRDRRPYHREDDGRRPYYKQEDVTHGGDYRRDGAFPNKGEDGANGARGEPIGRRDDEPVRRREDPSDRPGGRYDRRDDEPARRREDPSDRPGDRYDRRDDAPARRREDPLDRPGDRHDRRDDEPARRREDPSDIPGDRYDRRDDEPARRREDPLDRPGDRYDSRNDGRYARRGDQYNRRDDRFDRRNDRYDGRDRYDKRGDDRDDRRSDRYDRRGDRFENRDSGRSYRERDDRPSSGGRPGAGEWSNYREQFGKDERGGEYPSEKKETGGDGLKPRYEERQYPSRYSDRPNDDRGDFRRDRGETKRPFVQRRGPVNAHDLYKDALMESTTVLRRQENYVDQVIESIHTIYNLTNANGTWTEQLDLLDKIKQGIRIKMKVFVKLSTKDMTLDQMTPSLDQEYFALLSSQWIAVKNYLLDHKPGPELTQQYTSALEQVGKANESISREYGLVKTIIKRIDSSM